MRKKMMVAVSILVAMMMFSGCMDIRLNFSLKEDGSGGMNAFMAVNQSIMGDEETSEMESNFFDETGINDANAQIENTPLEYYKDDMLFVGEEFNIQFSDPLIAFSDMAETDELHWTYQGDDVYRFEIPLSQLYEDVASEGMGDVSAMFKAMGGQLIYSFETDYEVIDHNADYIEDDTNYIWDLTEEVFSLNPGRESGFLEIRMEIEASENELRNELEESLDMDRAHRDFHGEILASLGYLKGTDDGLELDRNLTRAEGAIMYSRLLGLEEEAQVFASENPNYESGFTDVPEWAEDTLNYLHHLDLVNGISETLYGSNAPMTEAQYTTLVLRALGYSDRDGDFVWSASTQKALDIDLYADDLRDYAYTKGSGQDEMFTRRMMSYISYNALFFENTQTQEVLFEARTEE